MEVLIQKPLLRRIPLPFRAILTQPTRELALRGAFAFWFCSVFGFNFSNIDLCFSFFASFAAFA